MGIEAQQMVQPLLREQCGLNSHSVGTCLFGIKLAENSDMFVPLPVTLPCASTYKQTGKVVIILD